MPNLTAKEKRALEPWGPRDPWQCTSVDDKGWICVLGAGHTVPCWPRPHVPEHTTAGVTGATGA